MAFARVPSSVQQAALTHHLDEFLGKYRTSIPWIITRSLIAVLVGGVGWVYLSEYIDAPEEGVPLLVLALSLFGLSLYLLFRVIQKTGQQMYLFERGIVIAQIRQMQVVPWEQGTHIWKRQTHERFPHVNSGPFVRIAYLYTFQRGDGYRIKLNNATKDIGILGFSALTSLTQELLPQALDAIRGGQELTFPPFRLTQQGISKGDAYLPWSQVQVVMDYGEYVRVKHENRVWESAEIAKMPNYLIFIKVAEEMIQQARGGDDLAKEAEHQ